MAWTHLIQAQVDITFRVDMSDETISAEGVHVAGDLNGWSTTNDQLTDQGGGIYMLTVSLEPGRDIQYKYLNGNAWGNEEATPENCTVGGNNRIFTVPETNDTLDLVPFNGCPSVVKKKHVIFRVDMSNETPSSDGIHVAGNFVAWDPGKATMTDLGDGIYEYKADVLASILTLQYKYVNGNAWGNEEAIPEDCKNGDSNRFKALAGDTINLATYVFGSCDTLAQATSSTPQLSRDRYQLISDPANSRLSLTLSPTLGLTQVRILDMQGRQVFERLIQAREGAALQVQGIGWSKGVYVL
ncbi:MAG: hypothetical protein AAF804_12300, partial [Bacteroidota bacterium]